MMSEFALTSDASDTELVNTKSTGNIPESRLKVWICVSDSGSALPSSTDPLCSAGSDLLDVEAGGPPACRDQLCPVGGAVVPAKCPRRAKGEATISDPPVLLPAFGVSALSSDPRALCLIHSSIFFLHLCTTL